MIAKHPDMIAKHPGMIAKHPGMIAKHPGMIAKHPGMMTTGWGQQRSCISRSSGHARQDTSGHGDETSMGDDRTTRHDS